MRPDLESVHASNGGTSVLISVLTLAASHLAQSENEIRWASFLAGHDQDVLGLGNVGTDIDDWPWSMTEFEADKAFLLKLILAAKRQTNWRMLDYEPHLEMATKLLDTLRTLIEAFAVEHINTSKTLEERWWFTPAKPELCALHKVYMHDCGCVICHDK